MGKNKVCSTTSQICFKNLATFAVSLCKYFCKLNFKKVFLKKLLLLIQTRLNFLRKFS